MSTNRITREDIIRLKLNKKRQTRKLAIIISSFIVVIVCVSIYIVNKIDKDIESSKGKEVLVGVEPQLGSNNISKFDYSHIVSQAQQTEQEIIDEAEILEGFEFIVPETSLSPVEDIQGNNWYDETYYQKNDMTVDVRYFSKAVFVGDSRTEGLILYSGIPNINGLCYKGLSVDKLTTDASIYVEGYGGKYTCYDGISMTYYDSYYCSFGVNELGWYSIDVYIDYFSDLIDHIRSVNPDAVIYVQSILPVSKKESEGSDIYKQERINEFNSYLLEMCKERKDVIYLDVASAVMNEEGYLPEEAAVDGIHCNADYCKRIIQYIRNNTYKKIN